MLEYFLEMGHDCPLPKFIHIHHSTYCLIQNYMV